MKTRLSIVALLFGVLVLPFFAGAAEEEGSVKNSVKSLMTNVVSTGKEILSGIEEGVEEGQRQGATADGARLIAGKDDLASLARVEVLKLERTGDRSYEVLLAVRNENPFPVRLTRLSDPRSVVLLDSEGFSYTLPDPAAQGADVTALGKAATRVRYVFSRVEGAPAIFRLYDTDFALP